MTAAAARSNTCHATFASCIADKLVSLPASSSTNSAPTSQKERSFLAALLMALSAFAA